MAWRLAYSLVKLRAEINALYPYRSTISDGTIGDTAHQAQGSSSDHNPWLPGSVVSALDITTRSDADPGDALAEIVRMDPRTKYVIRLRRIANGRGPWQPYYGDDPHDTHMHVSVSTDPALYDDSRDWLAAGNPDLGGAIGDGGLRPSTGNSDPLQEDDMFSDQDRADLQLVKAWLGPRSGEGIDQLQSIRGVKDERGVEGIFTRLLPPGANADYFQIIAAGVGALLGQSRVEGMSRDELASTIANLIDDSLAPAVADLLAKRLAQ